MATPASEQAERIAELEAATAGMHPRLLEQALDLHNLRLEQSRRSGDLAKTGYIKHAVCAPCACLLGERHDCSSATKHRRLLWGS